VNAYLPWVLAQIEELRRHRRFVRRQALEAVQRGDCREREVTGTRGSSHPRVPGAQEGVSGRTVGCPVNPRERQHQLCGVLKAAGYPTDFKTDWAKLGLTPTADIEDAVRQLEAVCERLGVAIPAPVEPVTAPATAPEPQSDEVAAAVARVLAGIEEPVAPATSPAAPPATPVVAAPPVIAAAEPKRPAPPKPGLNEAQVWGRAKRRQAQDEATGAHYTDGGWGRIPNLAGKLLAAMPAPCAKLYVTACLLAKPEDGRFHATYTTLAKWIGAGEGKQRQRHAERAMHRLCEAHLIQQEGRGSATENKANDYRLLSLTRLNLDMARAVLAKPLTTGGRLYVKVSDRTGEVPDSGTGEVPEPRAAELR
jgi:hypothetical protein